MLGGNNIEIHETAFVTSTFRATDVKLSRDHFAYLWNNPKTEKWVEEYLTKVSSEESFTHCLRNRYFLEKINEHVSENRIEVLINFGAGFSMYPFLLDQNITHIEIDKPEIVEYKKMKIEQWQKEALLPKRNIHFVGVDFSKEYKEGLLATINSVKGIKKCFILIEGVLFFLDREETDGLFQLFNLVQDTGDIIGSASFQDEIKESLVFKKLMSFFGDNISKASASEYQTIPNEYYRNIENYSLIDHQDYFSLSKTYYHKIELEKELILNENFYMLQKVGS
ncbi:Leucine carboxyl methyltransferase [Arenibacter palladensis]|uniref:Leucine carboxyl methyltransferase n=1 Tax=Arenibacter palladensis TaxID=237373 RepID=A0A1M5EDU9_9FLAO|nr:class I SAM-dependent methyltransferase [Arenibacter palladensis]SHF77272.1 Leucine carboxyl methyltransferase [Arenibacter palladensis]